MDVVNENENISENTNENTNEKFLKNFQTLYPGFSVEIKEKVTFQSKTDSGEYETREYTPVVAYKDVHPVFLSYDELNKMLPLNSDHQKIFNDNLSNLRYSNNSEDVKQKEEYLRKVFQDSDSTYQDLNAEEIINESLNKLVDFDEDVPEVSSNSKRRMN